MKRKLTLIVALALSLTLLLGCSTGGTATNATSTPAPATTTATAATTSTGVTEPAAEGPNANMNPIGSLPIVKDKITLTCMQYIRDTDAITMEGLWYAEKIEEDTNIHIDYTQVNQSEWDTQINLMFASGDYTDIIMNGGTIDSEIYGVDQGILVPLDDLINEYMPVYKERLDADPVPWQSLVKTDGKMYGVGKIADYGSNCSGEFFINQKWLDALKIAAPANTEQLYEALKAFVANDPNGNGTADEIGYEGIFDELTTYFFHLWGIPENQYHFSITDDKQVVFDPFQPGYREAIEYMARLYSEGLMDPATITQDANAKISQYNQNNVGLTTMHRLKSMGWDILEQDMVHLMPPAADGYSVEFFSSISVASEGAYFTSANEYLPESARWIDYQLEDQPTFESFYGPEGTLWNWNAEKKCELGPAGDQGVFEYALGVCGIYYMPSYYYNTVFQQPDYRLERIEYCEAYADDGYIEKYPINYARNLAKITSDDQTAINQIFASVEALYDETVADMIMHGVTDDKWNTFIANLEAAGAKEYIGYYQAAIDTFFAE